MNENETIKIINNFLNQPVEKNISKLIQHVKHNDLNDVEILHLANGLANSGETIRLNKANNICDIASTGGPSSLSTLICPLFLRILGNKVLKLGVPGRPAGGIDVLARIPGYNISPDPKKLLKWIKSNEYVHFLASKNFAPLDAILFQYRKDNNAINITALVIASLLSKKISVGLNYLGLDIRVSDFGNFGTTWEAARNNATRFNRIANLAGIRSTCFLTNGNEPQQPYIGRGEAILALHNIFIGNCDPHLNKHINHCFNMAYSISIKKNSINNQFDSLKKAFFENVTLQEGSLSSFDTIASQIEEQHKYNIRATEDGILLIDLEKIRKAILKIQAKSIEIFPDPCGIILKVRSNDYIKRDDVICTFRCESKYLEELEKDLKSSFGKTSQPIVVPDFEEII